MYRQVVLSLAWLSFEYEKGRVTNYLLKNVHQI